MPSELKQINLKGEIITIPSGSSSTSEWTKYDSYTIDSTVFDSSYSFVCVNEATKMAYVHMFVLPTFLENFKAGERVMLGATVCRNLPKPIKFSSPDASLYSASKSCMQGNEFTDKEIQWAFDVDGNLIFKAIKVDQNSSNNNYEFMTIDLTYPYID